MALNFYRTKLAFYFQGFSEELSNQMSGNERVVIPIDFRDQSQYDVPPPYSNTDV